MLQLTYTTLGTFDLIIDSTTNLSNPFFSLIKAYIASKFSKRVKIEDETTLSMRCGFSDIDPHLEINNGRYQTLADIGRFNHGFRTGFFSTAKKNKIYFTVAGASMKYRYRIPFGEKFKMTTKIIYVDDKWTYFLHKFIVNGIALLINKAPNIKQKNRYKNDSLSPIAPFRILNIGNTKKVFL